MSLLKTLKSGNKVRKLTRFPGSNLEIELRIITEDDRHRAGLAADALYKDNAIAFHNVSDYQIEKTLQQLYRAIVVPGTNDPIAESMSEFRAMITAPERDILVDEYTAFDRECNPSPFTMSDEEFDKLLFEVKKKPEQTIGNISNLHTLRKLCSFLASQPATLPTDSGSTSTQ